MVYDFYRFEKPTKVSKEFIQLKEFFDKLSFQNWRQYQEIPFLIKKKWDAYEQVRIEAEASKQAQSKNTK